MKIIQEKQKDLNGKHYKQLKIKIKGDKNNEKQKETKLALNNFNYANTMDRPGMDN